MLMKKRLAQSQAGFTFIELMVVIVIIGVLSVAGMVTFQRAGYSARNGKRAADQSTIQQALELYKADTGGYPVYPNSNDLNVLAGYYINMNQDLVSASYLNQTINDPKYVNGQVISFTVRKYLYTGTTTTYVLCYLEEPALIPIVCKYNP